MSDNLLPQVAALLRKGVKISNPRSVFIADDVDVDRISEKGVVIHTGAKIMGKRTLILPGAQIGTQGPVTIDSCQIGPKVELKSGYFINTVLLKKASMGSGAHVRDGTILEEEASGAHTVGLKQTILFPFVTLGSLINFCDCFIAGGTSRKDHSEVGSSFIHFNYTPNQDKATPSLMGDVPRGVMLNQRPIFLGGQGGLVGPCRLTFGTVTAAGTIYRKDELRPNRLLFERGGRGGSVPFKPGRFLQSDRIITNNIIYIANLMALRQWYHQVRGLFISDDFPVSLLKGLKWNIALAIQERIKRLKDFFEKLPEKTSTNRWSAIESVLEAMQDFEGGAGDRDAFLEKIRINIGEYGTDYLSVIKNLQPNEAEIGTAWLQSIVDRINRIA
ncbi:protein GlmU [Thermodesulfobacteriota bacterium]